MEKRCLAALTGPAATGPYSQAVAAGDLLFVSGQICLNPDGGEPMRGSFEDEARQALSNLRAILHDAGSAMDRVVKTTVFLSDMNNFAKLNDIYREFFPSDFPARTTIQVARLPLDAQIEIEAIALRGEA